MNKKKKIVILVGFGTAGKRYFKAIKKKKFRFNNY